MTIKSNEWVCFGNLVREDSFHFNGCECIKLDADRAMQADGIIVIIDKTEAVQKA